MPSVWASVRYQDGMRADLFAENPVSLLGKSDENFGMFVRMLDILINIYKAGLEISPLLWGWDGNFRGEQNLPLAQLLGLYLKGLRMEGKSQITHWKTN